MNGKIIVIFIAAMVIISLVIALLVNATEKETIKIGVIAPLSGGPALWGQGSLNMIELAVNEINANGGVNGKTLEVVAEDGKCMPNDAVTAAQKLIQVDKVKFILGGHCSSETGAIAPVAEENKIFVLAGVSTATDLISDYDYVFRTSPPNMDQARLIAYVALNKYDIKTAATITEQTTFAKSISDDFIAAFKKQGGNVVLEEEYQTGQSDFRTELIKIKQKNPDAIFISPQSPENGLRIFQQINELGIDAKLAGNTVFISKKTYADSHGELPDDSFSVAPYVNHENHRTKELINKYKNVYGTDVPYNLFFVGAAYDGVYMLKDALEVCGENATCVKDYFYNIKNWEGAVAAYSFNEKGDPLISNWRELRIIDGEEVFEEI